MLSINPKRNKIELRIAYNEKKLIEQAAKEAGLTMSEFTRKVLLTAIRQDEKQ